MNKVCLKSKWLIAIIMLVIMLMMGAGGCSVNGRYQIACLPNENNPEVFVIDTQTGEVRGLAIKNITGPGAYLRDRDYDIISTGPWR